MIDYSIAVRSAQPGVSTAEITETKAYAVAQISEVMTLQDFAKHITQHGSVYSRADVTAILILMVDCLREMLLEGKKVQLGDLGSFSVSLRTKGAPTAADFTADRIKGISVVWDRGANFCNLIEDAAFRHMPSRKDIKEACLKSKGLSTPTVPGDDDHVVE